MNQNDNSSNERSGKMKKAFIDASNVIRHTEHVKNIGPRLKNLKLAIEEVKDNGYKPVLIGDASLWYVFGELGDLPLELVDELNTVSVTTTQLPHDFKKAVKFLKEADETARNIQSAVKQHLDVDVNVDIMSPSRAIMWVSSGDISRVIGRKGRNIKKLEDKFSLKIDVKEIGERLQKSSFKLGVRVFDVVEELFEDCGLELDTSARVYKWMDHKETVKWIIFGNDLEVEVSKWRDKTQRGVMRLSVHDRLDEEYLGLHELVECGDLHVESTGREADEYILGFAERFPDSVIISNDGYVEYGDEYPFIHDRSRHLNFDIVDDEILIAGLKDARTPTPSREPSKGKIVAEERGEEEPRVGEKRLTTAVGTTLLCLGLLSLVFLPLLGLLDETSLAGAIIVSVIGGVLRSIGRGE